MPFTSAMVLSATVGILPFAAALASTVCAFAMTATTLPAALLRLVFRCFAQFLRHRELEHFALDELLDGSKA